MWHGTFPRLLLLFLHRRVDAGFDTIQRVDHALFRRLAHLVQIIFLPCFHRLVDAHYTAVAVGAFRLADRVNGGVAVIRHFGGAGAGILGDLQIQNDGVIGAAPGGVAEEVPQRIGHQRACQLIVLEGLHRMGVGADNYVHALLFLQVDDALLGVADVVVVFAAPVEQGDGDVRLLRFHSLQNAGDAGAVDLVVGAGVVLIEDVHQIVVSGGKSPTA